MRVRDLPGWPPAWGSSYSGMDKFVIHIYGKGMNSKIEINETDDLEIVDAIINKVKKNLNSSDNDRA